MLAQLHRTSSSLQSSFMAPSNLTAVDNLTPVSNVQVLVWVLSIVIPALCILFGLAILLFYDASNRRRLEHLIYNRTEFLVNLHAELTGKSSTTVTHCPLPTYTFTLPNTPAVYLPPTAPDQNFIQPECAESSTSDYSTSSLAPPAYSHFSL